MKVLEFKENIDRYINQANEIGNHINKSDLKPNLVCINDLDEVVEKVHSLWIKGLIDDTVAWNTSVALGVLLGEMIIKEHSYHWAINSEDIPVVETDDNNQLSPITKIYKIVIDEDDCEGSPSSFYSGFKAILEYYAMSDEEKEKITTYV